MDTETSKALEDSIEHWHRLATGTEKENESIYDNDCALCKKFRYQEFECNGCPVMNKTGKSECVDSPWIDAFHAYAITSNCKHSKFLKAAQKMYEFLCSLREPINEPTTPAAGTSPDDSTPTKTVS